MITFQIEDWFTVKGEMEASLWHAHWEEIAINRDKIKLDPDIPALDAMARAGGMSITTMREQGKLVGYHVTFVRPHYHYRRSLTGYVDIYYIQPDHRRGSVGMRLFVEADKNLAARGVQKVFTGTKVHHDIGSVLERLGYTFTERLYTKILEGGT